MNQKGKLFFTFLWIFSLAALALAFFARIRLLSIPLERDEGAFASIGYALGQGGQLYTTLFDNKPPLLYAIYGGFTYLFGYHAFGVHLGHLFFHFASCLFLYLWVNQYFNKNIALLSIAFFSIFALLPNVFGFAAHATQLLLPPALAGLWLINQKPGKLYAIFIGGALLSVAFLIKQQAIGIIAGGILLFIWENVRPKNKDLKSLAGRSLILLLGLVFPLATTIAWFSAQGRLADLLHWTIEIPKQLIALGDNNAAVLQTYIFRYFHGFEFALGLVVLGTILQLLDSKTRLQAFPFILLFVLTLATTYLGAAFYPHYFVLTLPFFAALCASGVVCIFQQLKWIGSYVAPLAALFAIGYPIMLQTDYFFEPDFRKIHRQAYGLNPFPEMETIGQTLRRQSKPGDIMILGSEPEAWVAAGQIPPTGYPFMLDSRMPGSIDFQQKTIAYLKNKKPLFVIFVPALSSWYPGYQQSAFVRDLQAQLQQNYALTGAAQIDKKTSRILWDDEARKTPEDPSKIGALIFRRKE